MPDCFHSCPAQHGLAANWLYRFYGSILADAYLQQHLPLDVFMQSFRGIRGIFVMNQGSKHNPGNGKACWNSRNCGKQDDLPGAQLIWLVRGNDIFLRHQRFLFFPPCPHNIYEFPGNSSGRSTSRATVGVAKPLLCGISTRLLWNAVYLEVPKFSRALARHMKANALEPKVGEEVEAKCGAPLRPSS